MPMASISLLRHRAPAAFTAFLRQTALYHGGHPSASGGAVDHGFLILSARRQNPNVSGKPQPSKNILRAKHTFKEYSSLAPILAPDDKPSLSESQAVGMVATAQANFMRVIVHEGPGLGTSLEQAPEVAGSSAEGSGGDQLSRTGVELLCVVKAVLKKIRRRVLVGDKVLVGSIDWIDRRGMIENVFQRRSEILDPPVANVDHLLVFFSLDQPKVEPFMLTRFLVEAESTGIPLTLALNKTELVSEEELESWKIRLRKWGYEPLFCSVETKHGLDALAFYLRNQTSVIVGPSGVGKSSLINVLRSNRSGSAALEEENWFEPILGSKWFEDQRVGEVSTRSGKGKHTTRNVSLLPLSGGGYLADTPGFNQPSLLKVTKQSLAQAFPEIRRMLEASEPTKCAFKDCLHLGEPGCLVKDDWERYPYYLQLLDEIRIREEFQIRTFGTKREGDVRYKVGDMGVKQAEPRLEPKKHRRQSRKKMKQLMLNELEELEDEEDDLDLENDPIVRAIEKENQ